MVTDSQGNMVMRNLPVMVNDSAGYILATGTTKNGIVALSLPNYRGSATETAG